MYGHAAERSLPSVRTIRESGAQSCLDERAADVNSRGRTPLLPGQDDPMAYVGCEDCTSPDSGTARDGQQSGSHGSCAYSSTSAGSASKAAAAVSELRPRAGTPARTTAGHPATMRVRQARTHQPAVESRSGSAAGTSRYSSRRRRVSGSAASWHAFAASSMTVTASAVPCPSLNPASEISGPVPVQNVHKGQVPPSAGRLPDRAGRPAACPRHVRGHEAEVRQEGFPVRRRETWALAS
jgi:hypothetical protein